jgi:uncharacterized protein YgiM (DUF1202 family)
MKHHTIEVTHFPVLKYGLTGPEEQMIMKRVIITFTLLLVAFSGFAVQEVAAQSGATAVVTAWHLNVRDFPNPVTGQVIARVGRGEVYPVTARSSINHWWQIQLPDGRRGWVNGFYLSISNAHLAPSVHPGTPSPVPAPAESTGTVTAWHLNVRHIPNPFTGQIIARVGRGEVYPVIGRNANSSWWQIRLPDARTGWVNGLYITVSNRHLVPQTDHTTPTPPPAAPITTTGTVTAHFLNVRQTPNPFVNNIIAVIGRGQNYEVIGRNAAGTWWQIRVGSTTGWVSGTFFAVSNPAGIPVTG